MSYANPDKPKFRPLRTMGRSVMLMMTGGVVMTGVMAGVGIWQTGDRFWEQMGQFLNPVRSTTQVDVRSTIIQQVRQSSELTTAVFTMQTVVPASQASSFAGFTFGTTKLLYIGYGQVQAGVDLSQLTPESVQVVGETLRIQLPMPRILSSNIDVSRSTVYDYDRGFLSLGPDTAPQLQGMAQQEALKQIRTAACQNGLLTQASDRAKFVITQLLTTVGYKSVLVETPPLSVEACLASAIQPVPSAPTAPPASPSPSSAPTVPPATSASPLPIAPSAGAPLPQPASVPSPTVTPPVAVTPANPTAVLPVPTPPLLPQPATPPRP